MKYGGIQTPYASSRRADGKANADADQVSETLPDTQFEPDANDSPPFRGDRNDLAQSSPFELRMRTMDLSVSDPTLGWTVGKRRPLAVERTFKPSDLSTLTSRLFQAHE